MTNLPHVKTADVKGKRVFLRCDHNIPLVDKDKIADESRILASLRTIHYLLDKGARVFVTSHLGRPKGKVVPELSLTPVAKRLSELIGIDIPLVQNYVDGEKPEILDKIQPGQMAVLENVRFHD